MWMRLKLDFVMKGIIFVYKEWVRNWFDVEKYIIEYFFIIVGKIIYFKVSIFMVKDEILYREYVFLIGVKFIYFWRYK